jgi:hypothetical protein
MQERRQRQSAAIAGQRFALLILHLQGVPRRSLSKKTAEQTVQSCPTVRAVGAAEHLPRIDRISPLCRSLLPRSRMPMHRQQRQAAERGEQR